MPLTNFFLENVDFFSPKLMLTYNGMSIIIFKYINKYSFWIFLGFDF